jgi:hypothetical protein
MIDDDVAARAAAARAQVIEDVGQLAEPELGRSTTPSRVLREPDRRLGLGGHRHVAIVARASTGAWHRLPGRPRCDGPRHDKSASESSWSAPQLSGQRVLQILLRRDDIARITRAADADEIAIVDERSAHRLQGIVVHR